MSVSRTAALNDVGVAIRTGATLLRSIRARQLAPAAPKLYLQLFNVAGASVVLGTTVADEVLLLPAGDSKRDEVGLFADFHSRKGGQLFDTALSVFCTTTANGLTAPTAGQEPDVTIDYEKIGA